MNNEIRLLVTHLKKSTTKTDMSIQWAKHAEYLLNELEDSHPDLFVKFEEMFDLLHEKLSLYSPGNNNDDDFLIGTDDMYTYCRQLICKLENIEKE